jgi:hypothetical protein
MLATALLLVAMIRLSAGAPRGPRTANS